MKTIITYKEAAEKVNIKPQTLKNHVRAYGDHLKIDLPPITEGGVQKITLEAAKKIKSFSDSIISYRQAAKKLKTSVQTISKYMKLYKNQVFHIEIQNYGVSTILITKKSLKDLKKLKETVQTGRPYGDTKLSEEFKELLKSGGQFLISSDGEAVNIMERLIKNSLKKIEVPLFSKNCYKKFKKRFKKFLFLIHTQHKIPHIVLSFEDSKKYYCVVEHTDFEYPNIIESQDTPEAALMQMVETYNEYIKGLKLKTRNLKIV